MITLIDLINEFRGEFPSGFDLVTNTKLNFSFTKTEFDRAVCHMEHNFGNSVSIKSLRCGCYSIKPICNSTNGKIDYSKLNIKNYLTAINKSIELAEQVNDDKALKLLLSKLTGLLDYMESC